MSNRKFIVITGPTASGKTDVAVKVAKILDSQIISADSMQIYMGMDIGTAKVTAAEMQGVPHHLLDVVTPAEDYSTASFQKDAFSLINQLNEKGVIPIVCGGTGLYINALVYKLDFFNHSKDENVRQKYAQLADDKSIQYLYNILKTKDPKYASIISSNDKKRIIRRLEIIEATGIRHYNFRQYNDNYDIITIGLRMPRDILYERINRRVDNMIKTGLVDEVKRVYSQYGRVNALMAIGYNELISYFEGKCDLAEAIGLIKRNTRRLAKRQITWFNRDERIKWFDISAYSCIEDTINDIIIYIKGKGF
ncbi:MAG: tRNA (adenosine(37)-N6)-dimethylallyltransferase MiaA [Christensenellales bacterium]|jgi:tRNA dimethylallyltransferase